MKQARTAINGKDDGDEDGLKLTLRSVASYKSGTGTLETGMLTSM